MRSGATVLMWLITTLLLATALPGAWVQQNLVDRDGYTALAERAAADPELQAAMAGELTAQVGRLSSSVDSTVVSRIAAAYTAGPAFPAQFAQANGFAHRWLFTTAIPATLDPQGRWVIDLAPMLSDAAFAQTLRDYDVAVPTSLPIPLTENVPEFLRPGSFRTVGMWGPWISVGLVLLAGAGVLLTLFSARRRGRALAWLGVSGLLVGASGWAAIELAQRHLLDALNNTSGTTRRVADVMVATAQDSMHQWLNVTLVVGGGLIVVGVIVSLLSGLAGAT
ncbi:MAG: hypothetical protein K0U67_08465 [Actinomycetia bacterium]|nr:hypothetical protein [Actinomycetes bacterium]